MDGKQRFWSNFRALAGANAASLAIGVGLAPVLSWIYPPEAFGLLAYFMFVFQLAVAVCTWRFDWLVPNARSTGEELALIAWGTATLVLVCLALLAGALLVPSMLAPSMLAEGGAYAGISGYLVLVPLAVLGFGLRMLITARFVRTSRLKPVSHVKILETIGNAILSILLGLAGFVAIGLIGARVASCWAGVGHLFRRMPIGRAEIARLSPRRLRTVLARRGGTASKAVAVSFFNTLSVSLPILVLGWFGSIVELGLYLMATRLVSTPIRIGANALSQSFWARSAELARDHAYAEMQGEYLALLRKLGLVALLVLGLLLPGSYALELVFPAEWAGLDQILRAFAPMVLGLVTVSSTNHLVVLDKAHWQFWADGTRLGLMLASVGLLGQAGAPFWALVLAVSLASLAGHAVLLALHLRMYAKVLNKAGAP